ncbi:hypothetical protein ACQZV8_02800 [Magnetococcales bacterium HHB-1]
MGNGPSIAYQINFNGIRDRAQGSVQRTSQNSRVASSNNNSNCPFEKILRQEKSLFQKAFPFIR